MKNKIDSQRATAPARSSLLILLILTVVNIMLLFFKSSSSFPYSLFFTYFASFVAYDAWMAEASSIALLWGIAGWVELTIFFIAWWRSAKKPNWLLVAGILYLLDTAFMVWIYSMGGFDAAQIIDYLMHAWIVYSLFSGWFAGKKQKEYDRLVIIDQPLPEEVHPE